MNNKTSNSGHSRNSRRIKKELPVEVSEAIEEIGGLDRLACNIPSDSEIGRQLSIHQVLSDKTRLKILWAVRYCDLCPCVLKEFFKISDSKLSYHLSVLEKAKLVTSYPKKNWRIFSITDLGKEYLAQCD